MIVNELWRYPVKSIRGESCADLQFEPRGVARDRFYAVVNADGKFGSHKRTRRFVPMPGMYEFAARITSDGTEVNCPSGDIYQVGDPALDNAFSERIGESVAVKPETHVPHMDDGAVHIVTTASMRWLIESLPDAQIDSRRFRPNVVIDCDDNGLVEQQWLGKTLQIGTVLLRIEKPAQRCVMATEAIEELPDDPRVLNLLAKHNDTQFGVYASVERSGTVAVNDAAQLL